MCIHTHVQVRLLDLINSYQCFLIPISFLGFSFSTALIVYWLHSPTELNPRNETASAHCYILNVSSKSLACVSGKWINLTSPIPAVKNICLWWRELKKDKGRESISCPPAPFPVRTRRVIESFQGRLREGHADDQLRKTEGLLLVCGYPAGSLGLLASNSNRPA